jgi:hypothetical protein
VKASGGSLGYDNIPSGASPDDGEGGGGSSLTILLQPMWPGPRSPQKPVRPQQVFLAAHAPKSRDIFIGDHQVRLLLGFSRPRKGPKQI